MAAINKKYILIKLSGQWWAWPLDSSSQFFNPEYILPLPINNRYLAGLSYHRGRILTVLKTDQLIGLAWSKANTQQALWFEYRDEAYALLIEAGGETLSIKNLSLDARAKVFKKYFKHNGNKIYCLEPDVVMSNLKFYDQ